MVADRRPLFLSPSEENNVRDAEQETLRAIQRYLSQEEDSDSLAELEAATDRFNAMIGRAYQDYLPAAQMGPLAGDLIAQASQTTTLTQ